MKNKVIAKVGHKCPASGQYVSIGNSTEITMIKNKVVPPSKNGSTTYVLVDKTKHRK